jgi:hypothetical protein
METIEYRCVLVLPRSHTILVTVDRGQYPLPRIGIPRATRPAPEVKKMIKSRWGLNIFVLEIWADSNCAGALAVAEVLMPQIATSLTEIPVEQLTTAELSEEDRGRLQQFFDGRMTSQVSRLGWIDEAFAWIGSATGQTFSSSNIFEQWNAGQGFALVRVTSDEARNYWLKAAGKPNTHEFMLTSLLSELYADFLPRLVATKKEWNAWLTEDAGDPLPNPPSQHQLVSAAKSMASLQFLSIGQTHGLLGAGAFDQRLPALKSQVDTIINYLIEAMARQTSTKAMPLSHDRLLELSEILHDACFRLEALGIPDALVHNDLNAGNILSSGTRCLFTDWSEAAVGNPFLMCERLCQLNRTHAESVRNIYRECWSHRLSAQSMDEAIALSPLLAIYAYLYGRGDWLRQTEDVRAQSESYARSLARHMDRAARDLSLREIPCH